MKAYLLILALSLLAPPAFAGRETNNGGDPVAIEFQRRAMEAIANARENSKFIKLPSVDFARLLDSTEILVVDTELSAVKDGVALKPAAVNSRNPNRVLVNRAAWKGISSLRTQQRLALHELLCLAGIEETGVYRVLEQFDEVYRAPKLLPVAGDFWQYRDLTADEQARFRSVWPSIEGFDAPDEVEAVSQSLWFPMQVKGELMEVTVQLLHYDLDYKNVDDNEDFYQVLVTDVEGNVIRKDLVLNNDDIRLSTYRDGDILITHLDRKEDGAAGLRIQSLNSKENYVSGFWDWKSANVVDHVRLDDPYRTILLGKPTKDGPYGLYSATAMALPTLIKAFKRVSPGFEDPKFFNDPLHQAPGHVVNKIIAAYSNDRGTYVIVNEMEGLLAVNIDTGESKLIYEVPEEGRYSVVLAYGKPTDKCTPISLGIYRREQVGIFRAGLTYRSHFQMPSPAPSSEAPLYVLSLGVVPNYHFFNVVMNGCN